MVRKKKKIPRPRWESLKAHFNLFSCTEYLCIWLSIFFLENPRFKRYLYCLCIFTMPLDIKYQTVVNYFLKKLNKNVFDNKQSSFRFAGSLAMHGRSCRVSPLLQKWSERFLPRQKTGNTYERRASSVRHSQRWLVVFKPSVPAAPEPRVSSVPRGFTSIFSGLSTPGKAEPGLKVHGGEGEAGVPCLLAWSDQNLQKSICWTPLLMKEVLSVHKLFLEWFVYV